MDTYDYIGLSACCGADHTDSFKQIIRRLISSFKESPQKREKCFDMFGNIRKAVNAWDILFVSRAKSATCKDTVTIGGKCYNAYDVNFTLWGLGARLCSDAFLKQQPNVNPLLKNQLTDSKAAKWLAKGWKVIKALRASLPYDDSSVFHYKNNGTPEGVWQWSSTVSGWIDYGYQFPAGTYPEPQSAYNKCSISKEPGEVLINAWPWIP
jgi:hypothetical protein